MTSPQPTSMSTFASGSLSRSAQVSGHIVMTSFSMSSRCLKQVAVAIRVFQNPVIFMALTGVIQSAVTFPRLQTGLPSNQPSAHWMTDLH